MAHILLAGINQFVLIVFVMKKHYEASFTYAVWYVCAKVTASSAPFLVSS